MPTYPASHVDSSVVAFQRGHARIGPSFSTSQFNAERHKAGDGSWLLSTDASDLGLRPGLWPLAFYLTSAHTGRTVIFNDTTGEDGMDGEGRKYTSTEAPNVKVFIWND